MDIAGGREEICEVQRKVQRYHHDKRLDALEVERGPGETERVDNCAGLLPRLYLGVHHRGHCTSFVIEIVHSFLYHVISQLYCASVVGGKDDEIECTG